MSRGVVQLNSCLGVAACFVAICPLPSSKTDNNVLPEHQFSWAEKSNKMFKDFCLKRAPVEIPENILTRTTTGIPVLWTGINSTVSLKISLPIIHSLFPTKSVTSLSAKLSQHKLPTITRSGELSCHWPLQCQNHPLSSSVPTELNWYYWETDGAALTGGERSYLPQAGEKQTLPKADSSPFTLHPPFLFFCHLKCTSLFWWSCSFLFFAFVLSLLPYFILLFHLSSVKLFLLPLPSLIENVQYLVERTDLTWNTQQSKPNAWTR